ncbi:MAG: ribbon-helix-helix domain-containing protein [ANME-2 cluster archaeon]|jgi:Arc/MetJ-type ribon-helix-helix transcriptional regulator|nr:ribbon-helix-helix domain-containing protein [ANME-2 cluster archaeon]
MSNKLLQIRVNDYLLHQIDENVNLGLFANRTDFVREAIRDLLRKYEIQRASKKMDTIAQQTAIKYSRNLSEVLQEIREEEDERS